ncbi:hypothetical protein [Lysobacter sp. Root690]|uniref:hypothetical protein n=1 Tax=Lysobacter sp. Root690 TaxID=1736588 RepID=UPI000B33CF1D|nr:hypothetical protein [Lysobacter sp. Root690]
MLATAAAIRCTVLDPRTVANAPAPRAAEHASAGGKTAGDATAAPALLATATPVTAVDR